MANYHLFEFPDSLASRSPREWAPDEAYSYFDWFLTNMEQRIQRMASFFDEVHPEGRRDDLVRFGQEAAATLCTPPFSNGKNDLSSAGYALAADMGLLLARVLRTSHPHLEWAVAKGPKSYVSKNLPVLRGFSSEMELDPILVSVSQSHGVVRGKVGPDVWAEAYDVWDELAAKP